MIKLIKFELRPMERALGKLYVQYHDLFLDCELCVFKKENLWVRMPEQWITVSKKVRYVGWESKEISDAFQVEVLKQLLEIYGFDLQKGIAAYDDFWQARRHRNKREPVSTPAFKELKKEIAAPKVEEKVIKKEETLNTLKGFTEVKLEPRRERLAKYNR